MANVPYWADILLARVGTVGDAWIFEAAIRQGGKRRFVVTKAKRSVCGEDEAIRAAFFRASSQLKTEAAHG